MTHPMPQPGVLPVTRGLTVPFTLSLLIAACLLVASIAGLAFGQRGLYEPNPATLPAFLAQDVLSLLVGLPLLLGSAWLARRGSLRGLLVWMGSLFYLSYAYSFYILGDRLAPLFLLYAAIVSMSLYGLLYLLLSTDSDAVRGRFSDRTPTRWAGGFVAGMGLLMASVWAVAIVVAVVTGTPPTRVQLVVWPLDLVVAFPALFWGGVWLWRREPLGYVVGGIVLLKAAAEGLTLVVQTWTSVLMGGPGDPLVPMYALVGLGGLVLLVLYLRGVTTPPEKGNTGMKHRLIARIALIGLQLFLGVTAVLGAVSVVPQLPPEWLAGTPFPNYTVPALALGMVGLTAFVAAAMLLARAELGVVLSLVVGLGIAIFEVVETIVVGLDIWLVALGVRSTLDKGLPGTDLQGVPVLLGVPVPLWQQPAFFVVGVAIVLLALRLRPIEPLRVLSPAGTG